jgi:GAF domain-containing protein/anti-sigma regulatory factor (Ser/Thr protein kinase)
MRDLGEIRLIETRLKALLETSKAVNSTSESREILELVVRSCLSAIPVADRGSIHFHDEGSEKLNLMISSYDYSGRARKALSFEVGEGIAGWVFAHQQPVKCGNALEDPRYKFIDDPEVKPHRSMLCVPITGKRRKIGVISLSHSTNIEAFSPPDLDLLIGFADQAAVAIENAEQITRIKKETEELDFLRSISLKINAQIKIEEILTAILESGNKLLGTEMAVIHWRGRSAGKIQTFVAPTELQNLMTEPREEDGLTAEVFRSGEPVVIPDTSQDTRVNLLVRKVGILSLVGYPLKLSGQVTGALFFNSRKLRFFGEHEIHLISLLLPLAAVAIENSNIIERLERTRRLSESLMKVSSQLAATNVLEEQMVALKSFMLSELAAPICFLGLYEESDDTIELEIYCEDCADQELFSLPIKNGPEWTISSFVVKKQQPILWFSEKQKHDECLRLGINPLQIRAACWTCLAFPLEVEGEILGVISIQSQEQFAWDEIEVSTFQTLAHQASISIRNSRLMAERNNSFERLENFHKQVHKARNTAMIVAQMTALGDLKNTLDSIVKGVQDVLDCDIVTLYTYRQEKDLFDYPPAVVGKVRFPDEITRTGAVARNAAPYKIIEMDDIYVSEDSQNDTVLGTPFTWRENVCSSIAAPLIMRDRRLGVLFINYCHKKHTFTDEELANIRLFSLQAAVAISNAMLYEEEQKRREVLKIIDEAGRTVTSSLQLDEIFDNLAKQAHNLTGEKGEIASFATITIVERNFTVLMAAYPPAEEERIAGTNIAKINLDIGVNGRIGIIGRAVKNKTPLLVKNVEDHPDFLRSNPDTKCELAVPIIFREEVVGVINIEHNEIGGLDEEDLRDIQSLAAHAAVAIQNARIYMALQRKSQHQQAIYEASKIINASLERTQEDLLHLLVEQMVTKIVPTAGAMNVMGAVHLYDNEKKELKLECTYPQAVFGTHKIGEIRSLITPPFGKIGITGRAVLEKKPQRIGDVTRDNDYLVYSEDTKSELDMPMLEGQTVLGVLSLECDQRNGFDEDAEDALCAFAELAVIAILNTRRYQELKETRATVGNITAVAWMGLVSGAWRHTIGNMATTISDLSLLAQIDLEKGEPAEKIDMRLKKIQEIVAEIQKIPMPPLSYEEGVEPIYICQLVRDRINQFKMKERYKSINFAMEFDINQLAMVRASPEWLRRILDILIDNASNAMKASRRKGIDAILRHQDDGVEILISDSGIGIPEPVRSALFKEPIKKKIGEKGAGIGLFLANSIIQVYGGRLEVRSTGPRGTTMALWLPLLK